MGTDPDASKGVWTNVVSMVEMWYGPGEIQAYQSVSNNFASPPSSSSMETGAVGNTEFLHFTQLVWEGTEQVGCYTVPDCSGESLTFCNYYPAGWCLRHSFEWGVLTEPQVTLQTRTMPTSTRLINRTSERLLVVPCSSPTKRPICLILVARVAIGLRSVLRSACIH